MADHVNQTSEQAILNRLVESENAVVRRIASNVKKGLEQSRQPRKPSAVLGP
jgi:hypothetical protein